MEIGPQDAETKKALAGKEPGELRKALGEARTALASIDGAAGQLNKLIGDSKGPVRQFSENGLVELSLAIRELRQLTRASTSSPPSSSATRQNFLFTGKQGYTPK